MLFGEALTVANQNVENQLINVNQSINWKLSSMADGIIC